MNYVQLSCQIMYLLSDFINVTLIGRLPGEEENLDDIAMVDSSGGGPHSVALDDLVRVAVGTQRASKLFVLDPKWVCFAGCLWVFTALGQFTRPY